MSPRGIGYSGSGRTVKGSKVNSPASLRSINKKRSSRSKRAKRSIGSPASLPSILRG